MGGSLRYVEDGIEFKHLKTYKCLPKAAGAKDNLKQPYSTPFGVELMRYEQLSYSVKIL